MPSHRAGRHRLEACIGATQRGLAGSAGQDRRRSSPLASTLRPTVAGASRAACHAPTFFPRHSSPQIVAYNKMDVPDSSDYWEDVREQLAGEGVPSDSVFAIR